MFLADRVHRAVSFRATHILLASLILVGASSLRLIAQSADPAVLPTREPATIALPIAEDRGVAQLQQALRRLRTTASVMMIVAHPDDEDGALLTALSRGMGVRTVLFTLTRGEGGQNAMSGDTYDALGVMRTSELLEADEYYGAKQLWGTEADFGFSKTLEESFARWGHDRVLYDAVLAVRQERPQVIIATFSGAVTDGHGQHQVSGEIAQEVFKAAADPNVFPEQLKDGLQPWQPLAVYSMVPFAPITDKGMFDYATGKFAPAKFHNYVTDQWITGAPSADVITQVGTRDPILGRSYVQIAREGWGMQKSQYGGANPALSGPSTSSYHLWAVAPAAASPAQGDTQDLFHNPKVNIDTTIAGLARLADASAPPWLGEDLRKIDAGVAEFESGCTDRNEVSNAHLIAPIYRQTLDLYTQVKNSDLPAASKAGLELELAAKLEQFQSALSDLLGLDLQSFTTTASSPQGGIQRGASADEAPRSVSPGEEFRVAVHVAQATAETHLAKVWLQSTTGEPWKSELTTSAPDSASSPVTNSVFRVQAAGNAQPTQPFFTRPTIEQPYYDIARQDWRNRSFAPYPLSAWAQFTFDGLPIQLGEVVQTMQRVAGAGGIYQPLVVTPSIGVSIDPEARILPLDGSALPVHVTVHTQSAAEGTVSLKLPVGWTATPTEAHFKRTVAGDTEPIQFSVTPSGVQTGAYALQAVAHSGDKTYESGWRSVGYPGLLPYNIYKTAQLKTRKVDVKLAPGLHVGYVMGPGDLVPQAIDELGAPTHLLSAAEVISGNLSAWNVIVIGIRAYATRPELAPAQPRLDEFVRNGGTLIVQYQGATFPAPLPLAMARRPENVVDEQAPVRILDSANPLLTWPNVITSSDFDGWVEERGHSFLDTWDAGYSALTETADAGQDPQRGGLIVTHPGKGTYIYVAYALYRQLPELVSGSYRILANLLSAGAAAPQKPSGHKSH
jgi:LmbE family N-acetylglucosaminyl deacetylase